MGSREGRLKLRILVTGIGGDLGQAVSRALHETTLFDAEVVGADSETINEWTIGRFTDGWFHTIPPVADPLWLPGLREIALARGCRATILASGAELAKPYALPTSFIRFRPAWAHRVFADKLWTYRWMQRAGLPCVPTTPSAIIKPRRGSGSRGLRLVEQPYLDGPEYTIAVWNRRAIALRRELRGGATGRCWSAPENPDFQACVRLGKQVAEACGAKGSFNVQCRVVDGKPIVFEINPRFSSTASMRAKFGFEDVAWSVLENLGLPVPPEPQYASGRAVRYWEETAQVGGEWTQTRRL